MTVIHKIKYLSIEIYIKINIITNKIWKEDAGYVHIFLSAHEIIYNALCGL